MYRSRNLLVVVPAILFAGSFLFAESEPAQDLPVGNWAAAPYWSSSADAKNVEEVLRGGEETSIEPLGALPSTPLPLIAINPCRLVDTRGAAGSFGGPALVANATRTFILPAGPCPGLPADAGAWSLNFTIIGGAGTFQGGFLTAWPTGSAQPLVSTLNFNANQLVANAAVVPAGTSGAIDVFVNAPAHLLIDINGYYRGVAIVNTVNGLSGAVTVAAGTDVTITPAGNTLTIGTNATSSNTPNTIVRRDGTAGFSAGTVALSGNLALPASSSTAGQIVQNGNRLLHTGSFSVFLGNGAGNFTTSGDSNTVIGVNALNINASGSHNTAIGTAALPLNTDGNYNTAIGSFALFSNESGTIRIGDSNQTRAFLAGVRAVTTGSANGLAVLIDSNGQLGTTSSSASVKREIAAIGDASSPLLNLRPVSFFYRNDTVGFPQYGLIAEEVAKVMPELVQFSAAGEAETVRYHFLAPLLLSELQKQQQTIEQQARGMREQEEQIKALAEEVRQLKKFLPAIPFGPAEVSSRDIRDPDSSSLRSE